MSAPTRPSAADLRVRQLDTRLHGLDWLRAGATVLVVTLHAGIAYLVSPMPGLPWPTHDPVGSPTVGAITWWINGFVMPLFFVQSGFLAKQAMDAKGPRRFLNQRLRRLLAPFALGCILILPFDLYALLLGWAGDGKISLHKLRSLKIDSPLGDNLWGVSHLWFLQHLILFCLGAWALTACCQWLRERRMRFALPKALPPCHLATVPLLAVSGCALWWAPQLVIGFRHSWWPLPANLLFYAPWFALGWLARAERVRLMSSAMISTGEDTRPVEQTPLVRLCELRVVASLIVFGVLLPRIQEHVSEGTSGNDRVWLVSLFVLHAWLAATGCFGLCLRWIQRPAPEVVRYLSEASFWVYLAHHPVVFLSQVAVSQVAWPIGVKFLLAATIGVILPLLMYSAFVRQTWIGVVLNGQQFRRTMTEHPDIVAFPQHEPQRLKKSA